jgi:glycosyltransferase involved in cell wall biosynthesis
MKVSVLIPAYNCEATIRASLDSVLSQTMMPEEILVMDDGSTDNTASLLDFYRPHITVFRQANGGPSSARNALVAKARGELIAFLDSDDILHPEYLERQTHICTKYPGAVAVFAGHVNFSGEGDYQWDSTTMGSDAEIDVMSGLTFFQRFNHHPGPFTSYSFCCVPRKVLTEIGPEPFRTDGAEDFYCNALLSLMGDVVYAPMPLVAYRIREGSHSSNRLAGLAARVHAFELLKGRFQKSPDASVREAFATALASHRRSSAKYLIGAGRIREGRKQLWQSCRTTLRPKSVAKSLGLLGSTYLPDYFQPGWPTSYQR